MAKKWAKIKGHSNYSISSVGEFRNDITKKILKASGDKDGYLMVEIDNTMLYAHREVAKAFLGGANGKIIGHKDNNKGNPKLSNLHYITQSDNIKKTYESEAIDMGKFRDIIPGELIVLEEKDKDGKPTEKKYLVEMTLLKEGFGNVVDGNYYSKNAIKTAVPLALSRKKMFIGHGKTESGQVVAQERSINEWAATVREAWVDEGNTDGKSRARAKVQLHNPYIRQLADEAPDELVTSIEGRGTGKKNTIEGRACNLVEEVKWINAFNFVDYGGNADPGVTMLEKDKQLEDTEDNQMDITTIEQLKAQYPKLVEAAEAAAVTSIKKEMADNSELDNLTEQLKIRDQVILENQEELKKKDDKIDELTAKENLRLETEKKEKEAEEVKIKVDETLKESGLPDKAITDHWKNGLYQIRAKKVSDKDITIEEQIKAEIEDRKAALGITDDSNVEGHGNEKANPDAISAREGMWKNLPGHEPEKKKEEE